MRYRLKDIGHPPAVTFLENNGLGVTRTIGDPEAILDAGIYFSLLQDNVRGSVAFCHVGKNKKESVADASNRLRTAEASLILVSPDITDVEPKPHQMFAYCDDPMLIFVRLMRKHSHEVYPEFKTLSDFPESCYVGPGVHVAKDVTIGDNVCIEGNTYIYGGTAIGNHVTIKPNVVIAGEGFQFTYDDGQDEMLHWPHFAGVHIGDDVYIGSGSCIDRGLFTDTVLKRACCIDNLVHIAHNVEVGERVLIIAGAMIAGSVTIGKGAHIAPSASVRDGLTIGDQAFIGLASCVIRDVPPSTLVYGVPAKPKEQ